MRIEGHVAFAGTSSEAVWDFLTDPDRIALCLPGCEKLVKAGEDCYDMQMKIGIGAISGTFSGGVRLHGFQPKSEYQMSVHGSGGPGFVQGEGKIQLASNESGTVLQYSGHISVGGAIASVGHRMIGGAARMVIDRFFTCVAGRIKGAVSAQHGS